MYFSINEEMQKGCCQRQKPFVHKAPVRNAGLIDIVQKAMIFECRAYNYYLKLAESASTEADRQIIIKIRNDEAKHYNRFLRILKDINGREPEIPEGELPMTYEEGVKKAMSDELEASSLYQETAYNIKDLNIQLNLMHASHDEQRHALWLQYILFNSLK
jgi:rubrerythrin